MARSSTFPFLTVHMMLLLVGLLFISVPLYTSPAGYQSGPYYSEEYSTFNDTLTVESPVFRHNVTSTSSTIGISSLRTNNTPVTLVVRGLAHVHFNVTNVTYLERCPIVVERAESDLWVEVIRQGSDANMTITVSIQTLATATIVYTVAPVFHPAHVWGWVLSTYASVLLVVKSAKSRLPHREKLGLVISIVLVLVGTSCCSPLTRGNVQHDFDPAYISVSPPDQEFFFLLNETHPSSLLNLSSLFPEDGIITRCVVHAITSSNYPIVMTVSHEDSFTFVLEEECQDGNWWLAIPTTTEPSMLFSFERIDSDAELTLRFRMTYRTLQPREDIALPADLCAVGIAVMVLGVGVAVMVDRYSSSESSSSRDRHLL